MFLGPSGQAVGLALEATPKAGPAECLRVREMNLSDDRLWASWLAVPFGVAQSEVNLGGAPFLNISEDS